MLQREYVRAPCQLSSSTSPSFALSQKNALHPLFLGQFFHPFFPPS